uniref:Uncharacterized protein n=1 Tax=Myoviridae sp. ctXho31 TaxID=2825122 RepID=A0A8S5TWS4_9CAUD|nr:MAG TPA: hypothetical protein [Myoviridae sp. ctXho31]
MNYIKNKSSTPHKATKKRLVGERWEGLRKIRTVYARGV